MFKPGKYVCICEVKKLVNVEANEKGKAWNLLKCDSKGLLAHSGPINAVADFARSHKVWRKYENSVRNCGRKEL